MSTAVLISGQMRTFAKCFSNQRWMVYRHLPDPHFFITVENNSEAASIDLLRNEYGADRVHVDLVSHPDLKSEVNKDIVEADRHAPFSNSSELHRLLSQHWFQNEVWKNFQRHLSHNGIGIVNYDTFVRIRPDLWFHSAEIMRSYIPNREVCHSPWWGRFGGINDRFAIMGSLAAFAYFTVYPQIRERLSEGCPFHPESLLAACLEKAEIYSASDLRAEFSTLRMDGTSRPPEITGIDIAHAAMAI